MMRSTSKRPQPLHARRRGLLGLLQSLRGGEPSDPKRGRLLLESLEKRQLLAGDMELLFTDPAVQNETAAESSAGLQVTSQAEGELAPDLVQFAKDLADAGVEFYGAEWCPACTEQKELFEDGKDDLLFIEVTDPVKRVERLTDPTVDIRNDIGQTEGITIFPTWKFPDGRIEERVLTLEQLSQFSGIPIPQSEQPTFEPIGDQLVRIGSPLHIPVDAYDPDGGPLTVTVSVDDPGIIEATVLSGNRSIRIDMAAYGDMVFELFEQRAPVASGRVITLAQSGFYDGIIFHRVDDDFVIQSGDPTGTGTGGSTLGTFDDDFHPDLQHNRDGVLSYAKSSDDTNDSQFFITELATRFLDFNHSVFGQLVEGFDVRDAISEQSTPEARSGIRGDSQKPDIDIPIETIEVFNDIENSVVMLRALGPGTTNVTFTVTDQDGNSHSETVQVTGINDSENSQPFLNDIAPPPVTDINTPAELQLTSTDVEGDAVTYFAQSLSSAANGTVAVNPTTGLVTVTPATGFSGTINVRVGVEPGPGVFGNAMNDMDTQVVAFQFEGESVLAPTSVDLQTGSDSGTSNIDNITNLGSLSFLVGGVTAGATVDLVNSGSGAVIGTGVATGSSIVITTSNVAALGDGSYQIGARQTIGNDTSELSPLLTLVYDSTAPDSVVDSAATTGNAGRPYVTDLISPEEGSGLIYALSSAPSGATIDASTGVINWMPTAQQQGSNTFTIELTDAAGNLRTESFSVNVAGEPLAEVRLELTDLAGNPISSVSVGDEFLLNMIGVDARQFSKPGVYGVFADILFDGSLVRPVPGSMIDYGDGFGLVNKGTFLEGLIDELGAVNQGTVATNEAESLIATVRMEALASGTVNLRSEPADETDSEFLLFGIDDLLTAESVFFGSVSLAIGQSFVAQEDEFSVDEDSGTTTLDVLANDTVVDGDGSLTVVSVSDATSGGTVALESGIVRFTPDDDFNGDVFFTYRVSDSGGVQETVSVTVTVDPVNDPPDGRADEFNVDTNSTDNVLPVLGNDLIAPDSGETLTVTLVNPTTTTNGGTVSIASGGTAVNYTPATDFTGTDTFSYTVSDGELTDVVTVTVFVAPADNPPTANDDPFTVTEDDAEAEFDVQSNDDRDVDDQTFVIESVGTPSQGGSARVSSDGSQFFYAPGPNFAGTEEVTYTIRDTGGGRSIATVTFTVEAVNDAPPVANPDVKLNRASAQTTVMELSDLPDNVDSGETLTISVTETTSAGGSAEVDPVTQEVLYTPPSADFVGTDTISFTVSDGELTSSGTITIEVTDFAERSFFLDLPSTPKMSRVRGITLSGTNLLGESVEVPLSYSDQSASFDNVLPGDYVIRIPAIPFLQNASEPREIPVSSPAEAGDASFDSGLGRLKAQYVSIRDWLGSTPRQSILVAVAPGESSTLAVPSAAAELREPEVDLDDTGDNVTIRGKRTNGDDNTEEDVEATLPAKSDVRVQSRGEVDGIQLLKISVEEDDVTFTPVASNAEGESLAAESSPEGESLAADALQVIEPHTLTIGDTQPEGESIASAATTQADLFVPVASDGTTRTDATVLPLEEGDLWLGDSLRSAPPATPGVDARSVDQAMQEVTPELTIVSSAAESVAEDEDANLDEQVIDAVLRSPL